MFDTWCKRQQHKSEQFCNRGVFQICIVFSWCTHCFVLGRGALTVGVWSRNWGSVRESWGCKISLSICNANANSPEATKLQNSLFLPLKMLPPAQCQPFVPLSVATGHTHELTAIKTVACFVNCDLAGTQ